MRLLSWAAEEVTLNSTVVLRPLVVLEAALDVQLADASGVLRRATRVGAWVGASKLSSALMHGGGLDSVDVSWRMVVDIQCDLCRWYLALVLLPVLWVGCRAPPRS